MIRFEKEIHLNGQSVAIRKVRRHVIHVLFLAFPRFVYDYVIVGNIFFISILDNFSERVMINIKTLSRTTYSYVLQISTKRNPLLKESMRWNIQTKFTRNKQVQEYQ